MTTEAPKHATLIERFWKRVERPTKTGCWAWTGNKYQDGYGKFYVGPHCIGAHRFAYELVRGPVPGTLSLDHLCRNPSCVNPAHLEPVTHRQNVLRGEGRAARAARRTHCDQGHAFDSQNTIIRTDKPNCARRCRTCLKARRKRGAERRGLE